jgi:hypothetical protein
MDVKFDAAITADLRRYILIKKSRQYVKTIIPKVRSKSNIVIARYLFVQIGAGRNHDDPVFPTNADDSCLPQIIGDVLASNNDDGRDVNVANDDYLQQVCAQLELSKHFNDHVHEMKQLQDQFSNAQYNVHMVKKTEFGNHLYVTNVTGQQEGPHIFAYNALLEKLEKTCVFLDPISRLKCLYLVLLRYLQVLDSGTHQLAMIYDEKAFDGLKISVECYASPLNRSCDHFCGAFPDVDAMFQGYVSRFEDVVFQSGNNYTINPPYDAEVMEKSAEKVVTALSSVHNVTVFVTIPVWDYEGLLQAYPPSSHRLFGHYKEYRYGAFEVLKHSKFVKKIVTYKRDDLPYWDAVNLKKVYPVASYLITLSSDNTE